MAGSYWVLQGLILVRVPCLAAFLSTTQLFPHPKPMSLGQAIKSMQTELSLSI